MTHLYVPPSSSDVVASSTINLVNLLMRNTNRRVTVLQVGGKVDPDPEVYVVIRVDWRDKDLNRPILPQLPRVLSMLETLRGSRGVPKEVYLDSTDGVGRVDWEKKRKLCVLVPGSAVNCQPWF